MKEKTVTVRERKGGRGEKRVAAGCCEEAMEERRENGCVKLCVGETGYGKQQMG